MFTLDAETAAALLSGNFTIALGIPLACLMSCSPGLAHMSTPDLFPTPAGFRD